MRSKKARTKAESPKAAEGKRAKVVVGRDGKVLHRDMIAYAKKVSSSRRTACAFLERIGAVASRSSVTER
jgi:hypothetical protein